VDAQSVQEALDLLAVDHLGLDDSDRRFLTLIIEKHGGGPLGIETIAATLSEDVGTIEEVYEPYLMQIGFLQRTPRGRVITAKAYQHLHVEIKEK
jgi:Holliday junction DNA helicase RuvB